MAERITKQDCDRFSAIRTNDDRIEVLFDGMPWGAIAPHSPTFVFPRRIAILLLDSCEILSEYVDTHGKYPDWEGERVFAKKKHLISVEKIKPEGRRTNFLRLRGHVEVPKHQIKQLGTLKSLGFWCSREQIQLILDRW